MEQSLRTQVVTAAVVAAGPAGADMAEWQSRINSLAVQIAVMCSDRSSTATAIEQVESAKVFAATILGGRYDQKSTRVVVDLRTRPSTDHPDGLEQARTERTDTPAGREMSNRLRTLKDHRVLLWVQLEEFTRGSDGKRLKSRVIRHVEDLGVDKTADTQGQVA